jgi:DNA-binding NarL/FixJ family response regulator
MKKIVIVDDHPLVMKALQVILENSFPDYTVVEAVSVSDLQRRLDEAPQGEGYALAMIDLDLGGDDALDTIRDLWVRHNLPTIMMTGQFDYPRCRECQSQGAAGYVQKNAKIDEIVTAVKIVLLGGQFFPIMRAGQEAVASCSRFNWLTRRQQQVLDLVVDGRPNKYIAAQLGIGEGHVRNMVSQLFDNFAVTGRSRTHLSAIVSKLRLASEGGRRPS